MSILWCNGEWCGPEGRGVPWGDRGLSHGLGLFETLLAVDGRIPLLERHLARLQQSARRLGWTVPDGIAPVIRELLGRNGLASGRARVRLALTAGSGGLRELEAGGDRLCLMTAAPLEPLAMPLRLGLSPWRRNEQGALAGLKCTSYAENLVALDWARRQGFDEALWLNTAGEVCEAATANLFVVRGGVVQTPPLESGCLPGVAREWILELAGKAGLAAGQARLGVDDLLAAEECFLSSATRGPMPVAAFEGREFLPGPVTGRLAGLWEDSLRG